MSRPEATLDLVIVSNLFASGGEEVPKGPLRVESDDWNDLPGRFAASLPSLGLRFASFRDFRPESLVEQDPRLRSLLEVQRRLGEVKSGRAGLDALRAAAEAAGLVTVIGDGTGEPTPRARAPQAQAERAADEPTLRESGGPDAGKRPPESMSVFDLVDLDATHTPGAWQASESMSAGRRELDKLLGSMFGSTTPDRPPAAELSAFAAQVDAEIGRWMRGILHDPAFRACEAAWSGLRFLCRRIDFRSGVRLYALPASRESLPSAWQDRLVPFANDEQREARTVCVLLDFAFDATEEDLGLLAAIGASAAEHQIPVVAPLAPGRLHSDLSDPIGSARQEWQRFRLADESAWIALAANRFLLRVPYGKTGDAVRGLAFEEAIEGRDDLLWGGTHWLVGAAVAGSFAETGWGTDLTGARTGGLVEDLPVAAVPAAAKPSALPAGMPAAKEGGLAGASDVESVTSPLEHLPPESAALHWVRDGLIAVAGRRDTDRALIVGDPTVHVTDQTLAQRLFEAQIHAVARSIHGYTDPSKPVEQVASTLAAGLNFLASSPAGPLFRAAVEPAAGQPETGKPGSLGGQADFYIRVTPELPPLRGLDSFVLRIG